MRRRRLSRASLKRAKHQPASETLTKSARPAAGAPTNQFPKYLTPGVYVEEVASGLRPIEAVPTSVTAFVGEAKYGTVGDAKLIHGWADYEAAFGPLESGDDAMGMAVANYYRNGGKDAYVCRLADNATVVDYQGFFDLTLSRIHDISIIVLPGVAADGDGHPKIAEAVAHCEATRNRMLIADPPAGTGLPGSTDVDALSLTVSSYAVCYYPWIEVAGPEQNGANILVPPSAFAAGIWARTDGRRAVWKAPAGMQAGLFGVSGLEYVVGDSEQDQFNTMGLNCIRHTPGAGEVIWGSRTLATIAEPEWRYVPVRRTAIMIEQSINKGIQWAVFEPNDHRLWSALRANIESFMNGLFRAGAFQGEKASDAYFVRCSLGDTMTQGDINAGQVIVQVGFAPLKPAEFVILRIQLKVGQG